MDSTTAGSGDELVPTQEAAALWLDVNLETLIAPLFSRVDMPSNPFEIPLQLGSVNWYLGTENLAATNTALSTARQTLTAYELVAEVPWSLTLDEETQSLKSGRLKVSRILPSSPTVILVPRDSRINRRSSSVALSSREEN